ncbi:Chitin synthase 4, partial [Coemansia sp. S142-1]
GVDINDQLAFDWGHRAAQQGFTRAIFAMGYYYEMGVGCEPDINQANEWYKRAAAAGSVEAKERLNRGNVTNDVESTAALRRHVTQKRQKDSSSGRGRRRGGLLGRDKDKEKDTDKDKDGTSCVIM